MNLNIFTHDTDFLNRFLFKDRNSIIFNKGKFSVFYLFTRTVTNTSIVYLKNIN